MQGSPQARSCSLALFAKGAVAVALALALSGCKKSNQAPPPPPPVDAAVVAAPPSRGAPILAVDVPPGFNFPGVRAELQGWADTWSLNKITAKAWDLWGGMTANTEQKSDGIFLPVWETWCGNEEVFTRTCGKGLRPGRRFRNAAQLTHLARLGKGAPSDLRLASFNKFNPPMARYLVQAQAGPAGGTYDYTQQSSLAALNQAWPAGTPIASRTVQEAPYTPPGDGQQGAAGIEIKPVMFLVKQRGLSPVPLWQGVAGASSAASSDCAKGPSPKCHPSPNLWTTCVLVDPVSTGSSEAVPSPASPAQIASVAPALLAGFSCKTFLYAPLATIYSVQLNAQEAQEFNSAQGNGNAAAGDYAVLTAMHVSTKEIENWTWQTYWWQPGGDPPDDFPGSKAGMTDKINGHWRNYAMCTAYDQTQGTRSKAIHVCFNPYLETSAGIPDGTQSNCMSCHGTATVGSTIDPKTGIATLSYPELYLQPIEFKTDARFATFTRTDFSWAIPGDAQPPATGTAAPAAPAPAR